MRLCYPRRAASILATSILLISIIAVKARLASLPPAAIASVRTRGVICQERPQRSWHQPHSLASPPLLMMACAWRGQRLKLEFRREACAWRGQRLKLEFRREADAARRALGGVNA